MNNGRRAFLGLSDSVGIWRVPRLLLAVAAILAMLVSTAGAASATTPIAEPLEEEHRTPSSETALIAMEARMVAEIAEEMSSAALGLPSDLADMVTMEALMAAERAEEMNFALLRLPSNEADMIAIQAMMAAERAVEMDFALLRLPSNEADMIAIQAMMAAERAKEMDSVGVGLPSNEADIIAMQAMMAAEREDVAVAEVEDRAKNPELTAFYWYVAERGAEEFVPLLCCAAP